MRETFAFWGYGREVWEELVGPDRLMSSQETGPFETKFGRIIFRPKALDLLGEFRKDIEGGILSFVQVPHKVRPEGEGVVDFEGLDPSESCPLVTMDPVGRFRFYFNLDETIRFIQQEKYLTPHAPVYLKWGLKPDSFPIFFRKAVLRCFQISRWLSGRIGSRRAFPQLFKDFSVDIWRFLIRAIIDRQCQNAYTPLPLWPEGKKYACVLNHDVDTEWGFKNKRGIESFRKIEEKRGLRSAWMVVARLQEKAKGCLEELSRDGHEIGFHGTEHDHLLPYLPDAQIREQIAIAAPFLNKFHCAGFRSPSYHRSPALYRVLDSVIQYDMSMHDSFENVNSPWISYEGCSTCFPFKIEGTQILEIPTTIPEDFILELKKFSPSQALECQLNSIESVKRRQGVANILTHPEPQLSAREEWSGTYEALLNEITKDDSAWITLPRDLAHWWNRRQEEINHAK